MSLQSVVNEKLAFGVVGSFYDDSPRITDPKIVEAGTIGCAFTLDSSDPAKAVLGGSGLFAGIAVNSKEYTVTGLGASLNFKSGDIAQICSMGRIVIKAENAVSVGDAAFFNTTTGAIKAGTSGSSIDGYTEIAGSKFVLVDSTQGGLSVLELK